MIRLNNDYCQGAHPLILESLQKTQNINYPGYGLDEWCRKGADKIREYLDGIDVDIHFMVGGTQVNYTVIAAALRPYQGVISADTGHINNHEAGSVEHIGHKIHALPAVNGKLTAEAIIQEAEHYQQSGEADYLTQPKMVFLSFPSEFGTIYSKKELSEIKEACQTYGIYLYVDGARLGYGLTSESCDVTMADLAELTDVFSIGGTKCGALFGEAVVIRNPLLRDHFRTYMKQCGGILAKGWLLGLQFYTLFQDGLYFKISEQADQQAMRLKQAFQESSIPFWMDSWTNQQFVVLHRDQAAVLAKKYIFEISHTVDEEHICVRFCTSWSTLPNEVDELIQDIGRLCTR